MLNNLHAVSGTPAPAMGRDASDPDIVRGPERASLDAITEPDVSLALWERAAKDDVDSWLAALPSELLPHGRALIAPEETDRALAALFEQCGTPAGPQRDALAADMAMLIRSYAEIVGADLVDVRAERVEGDSCWKFHRDNIRYRLLCTYRGPSTQWVTRNRADEALETQRDYAGPLQEIGRWSVAVFNGCADGDETGVVHRSPHIEGTGQSRFLLCLNEQSIVSPPRWSG